MVERTAGSRSPWRSGRSGGYSFLSMIKDVLLVSVFVSFLVMNYQNAGVLLFLDRTETENSPVHHDFRTHPARPLAKVIQQTTKPIRAKKQLFIRKPRAERPKSKIVRQKEIAGSDQSQVVVEESDKQQITSNNQSQFLVEESDMIHNWGKSSIYRFDSAPIVDEQHKLLFFTIPKVACTTFKFLFRRIAGVKDWDTQDRIDQKNLPHNPEHNNLKYLWDYPIEKANQMMTDPEWTRAIFVRDPKIRFLSSFLDKAIGNYGSFVTKNCCSEASMCMRESDRYNNVLPAIKMCQGEIWDSRKNKLQPLWLEDQPCCTLLKECQEITMTLEGFLETIETCRNGHWGNLFRVFDSQNNLAVFCCFFAMLRSGLDWGSVSFDAIAFLL